MFRALFKSQASNMARTGARMAVPKPSLSVMVNSGFSQPAMKVSAFTNGVRYYSSFPELTRDIAKERILELLEGYDKIGSSGKQVTEESAFIQDLGLDSLDVVEVVMELEHEFNIQIPDNEADSLKTVGQAIDYVLAQPDAC